MVRIAMARKMIGVEHQMRVLSQIRDLSIALEPPVHLPRNPSPRVSLVTDQRCLATRGFVRDTRASLRRDTAL